MLASPVDQVGAEQAAVGEHPGVELDVVQRVAVVEDLAGLEAGARVDDTGVAQQPVAWRGELVGPFVGAARAVGAEAFEVAGAEEFDEPPACACS